MSQKPESEEGAPAPVPPQLPAVPGTEVRLRKRREQLEADALERLEREIAEVEGYRMPLMEHLIELKDRLLWSLGALLIGCGVGLYFAKDVYDFLTKPFLESNAGVEGLDVAISLVHSPFEGFTTYFKLALITGFAVASPVISYHLWAFIAPGLYKSERRLVFPLSFMSVVLFAAGAGFCYYVIFPYAFPFFVQVLDVDVNLSADGYLTSVMWMMAAFGGAFQLPVFAWVLARVGLIDHIDMLKSFRYAIVVIFIVAAVLTPPDPLTQILLAIPLTLLYILGIGIAWMATTKKRPTEAELAAAKSEALIGT